METGTDWRWSEMTVSYREAHQSPEHARYYVETVYRPGTYDWWVWTRERPVIERLALLTVGPLDRVDYLDFACGGGRILGLFARQTRSAAGVDVSDAMLYYARSRHPDVTLYHGDITQDPALAPGRYGFVTAFRFFTNAERALRRDALRALSERLLPAGVLMVNIHQSRFSMYGAQLAVARGVGVDSRVQLLSARDLAIDAEAAGLRLERREGVSWCTPRIYRYFGQGVCDSVERGASKIRSLESLFVDQIMVFRKDAGH